MQGLIAVTNLHLAVCTVSPRTNAVPRIYAHNQTQFNWATRELHIAFIQHLASSASWTVREQSTRRRGMGTEVEKSPEREVRMRSHFPSLTQQYVNIFCRTPSVIFKARRILMFLKYIKIFILRNNATDEYK
jgi:hypothetical protein